MFNRLSSRTRAIGQTAFGVSMIGVSFACFTRLLGTPAGPIVAATLATSAGVWVFLHPRPTAPPVFKVHNASKADAAVAESVRLHEIIVQADLDRPGRRAKP